MFESPAKVTFTEFNPVKKLDLWLNKLILSPIGKDFETANAGKVLLNVNVSENGTLYLDGSFKTAVAPNPATD